MNISTELTTLAELALSEARRQLEQKGEIALLVLLRGPDGKISRLELPEALNPILNDGSAKSLFFGGVRRVVEKTGTTAVIFANDSWYGEPTEKQKQIAASEGGAEKLDSLIQGKSLSELEAMGLVERVEALTVTVQTPSEVLVMNQMYERQGKRIHWGQRNEHTFAQAEWEGRQKMYG